MKEIATLESEVSVIIPRLHHRAWWHRLIHDHTANSIAHALEGIDHVNVTFVPYRIPERE